VLALAKTPMQQKYGGRAPPASTIATTNQLIIPTKFHAISSPR
jgi:hypothetical protein